MIDVPEEVLEMARKHIIPDVLPCELKSFLDEHEAYKRRVAEQAMNARIDMLVEAAILCTDKEPAETYTSRLGNTFIVAAENFKSRSCHLKG